MNKNSVKTMLFGIGFILLGILFALSKPTNGTIADVALGLFGAVVLFSGFFTKD